MKTDPESRRRRHERRMRTSAFFKRNGAYIGVAVFMCAIGGLLALLPFDSGRKEEKPANPQDDTPAAHSLDERLSEAAVTSAPRFTSEPRATFEATAVPTLMPDMTPGPSSEPLPTASEKLNSPLKGRLIRGYAMDSLIYSKTLNQWMTHSGADIAAPKGTEVRSVDKGTVEKVYVDDMLGTTVIIDHGNGIKTVYCGLKKEPPVSEGEVIEARTVVGYIGDTAISECADESHLHFELWKDGLAVDPSSFVLFTSDGGNE